MMRICRYEMSRSWMGALGCLLLGGGAWGQTQPSASSPPVASDSAYQAKLQTFRQQQQELFQERVALIAQGATAQQLQAWQQQNAGQLAALDQQSQDLAAGQSQALLPLGQTGTPIPVGATPAMQEFLQNRATLAKSLTTLPGQSQAAVGNGALKQWLQQNDALLLRQAVLSRAIAQQGQVAPKTAPPQMPLPANATPQMKAFLTARSQLVWEQIQLRNQYAAATPLVRAAALKQWQQQNGARLAQLKQLAQTIPVTTAN